MAQLDRAHLSEHGLCLGFHIRESINISQGGGVFAT
jgi:hypothetical protein